MTLIEPQSDLTNSKRAYDSLADYANAHGAPEAAFLDAGWGEATVHPNYGRPGIPFTTATGTRWRFIDGSEQRPYHSPSGYTNCLYRFQEAIAIAQSKNYSLLLGNGEASTVTGQYHGLPVTAITGGEKRKLPPDLLDELRSHWDGAVVIAFDSDTTGRTASRHLARQLVDAGIDARAVDMQLHDGGDLADWCQIHGDDADKLYELPSMSLPEPPAPRQRSRSQRTRTVDDRDYDRAWEEIRQQILPSHLGITDYRTNDAGFVTQYVPNPLIHHEHDHIRPRSQYNPETGVLYDHKGQHTHHLLELCAHYNIPIPERTPNSQSPSPELEQALRDYEQSLACEEPARALADDLEIPLDDILELDWSVDELNYVVDLLRKNTDLSWCVNGSRIQGGVLSALLNVFPKGSGAVMVTKLLVEYVNDNLPRFLTAQAIAQITGLTVTTVRSNMTEMMLSLGLVREVSYDIITDVQKYAQDVGVVLEQQLLCQQLSSNSRGPKPTVYECHPDRFFRQRLEAAAEEVAWARCFDHILAPPTDRMANALGAGYEDFTTWRERMADFIDADPRTQAAQRNFLIWLNGNRSDWRGLRSLLSRDNFMVNVANCESLRQLRCRLYCQYINTRGDQNRMRVYQYLLACSDTEVYNVMDAVDMKSVAQYEEVAFPNQGDLDTQMRRIQRQHRGKIIRFEAQGAHSTAIINVFRDNWEELLAQYRQANDDITAVLRVASRHVPMTPEDIAARDAARASNATSTAGGQRRTIPSRTGTGGTNRPADSPPAVEETIILSETSPEFLQQQLLMGIERTSPYQVDEQGNVVHDDDILWSPDSTLYTLLQLLLTAPRIPVIAMNAT